MKIVVLLVICFLRFAVICNSQSIVSVSPSIAYKGDYVHLVVKTTNTSFTHPSQLYFTLNQGNNVIIAYWSTVINDSTFDVLFCLYQQFPVGYYDLTLTYNYYPGYQVLTFLNAMNVLDDPTPPTFLYVNPDTIVNGKIINLQINTTNTHYDHYQPLTWLIHDQDSFPHYAVIQNDSNRVIFKFLVPDSAEAGSYDLALYHIQDGTIDVPGAITILENPHPGYLVSCSPDTVTQGGDIELEIDGSNTSWHGYDGWGRYVFLRKSDNHEIITDFNHYDLHGFDFSPNDSTLIYSCSLNYFLPPGVYDVITRDPLCDTLVLYNALTILEGPFSPSIISVQPDTIYVKDSVGNFNLSARLTIIGKNTFFESSGICRYFSFDDTFWMPAGYQGYDHYIYLSDTCIQVDVKPYKYQTGWKNLYFGNDFENLIYYNAFYVDNPTYGIKEVSPGSFSLSPNPTTGIVTLETKETMNQPAELTILNINGQIIEKTAINTGCDKFSFDLSGKQKGVYMVKLSSLKGSFSQKLILQ